MKDKKIKPLDSEIQLIQMEKFINDFDKSMNKSIKNSFKNLLYFLLPILVGIIGIIIFPNPITLALCMSLVTITVTINQIVESKKIFNKQNKNVFKSDKIFYVEEEKDIEQVLEEGIGNKEGKDFYTENIKTAMNSTDIGEKSKYEEALEKQKLKGKTFKILEKEENIFLNKDETMIQLVRELDFYCDVYNIPQLKISNNDWEKFFAILYKGFIEKQVEDKFYESMSLICRFTLAKALINNLKNITIKDFIDNLYYLEKEYSTNDVTFSKKEILIFQKKIISSIYHPKIIEFQDFKKDKGRKK